MTFAWYGHLKPLAHKPWIIAALVSWGIALFEYLLQVPANRISMHAGYSVHHHLVQSLYYSIVFYNFELCFTFSHYEMHYF